MSLESNPKFLSSPILAAPLCDTWRSAWGLVHVVYHLRAHGSNSLSGLPAPAATQRSAILVPPVCSHISIFKPHLLICSYTSIESRPVPPPKISSASGRGMTQDGLFFSAVVCDSVVSCHAPPNWLHPMLLGASPSRGKGWKGALGERSLSCLPLG